MFVVDLETVSFFSKKNIKEIVADNNKYLSTPFLFLVTSYYKNLSLDWAYKNLKYDSRKEVYSWIVYKFTY